jgi:hypothetical protein
MVIAKHKKGSQQHYVEQISPQRPKASKNTAQRGQQIKQAIWQ